MNERIQELFKRAGGKTSVRNLMSNPVQFVETHELWDDRIEKFAELIVRECLTFVEPMPGSGDIDDLALEAAYNQIKEHFGVEE